MELFAKLGTEWSEKFPDDPLPDIIPRYQTLSRIALLDAINKSEKEIEELKKKLKQEKFLKEFLNKLLEKLPQKNVVDENAKIAPNISKDFKPYTKSAIGNLIAETVSISTQLFQDNGTSKNSSVEPPLSSFIADPDRYVQHSTSVDYHLTKRTVISVDAGSSSLNKDDDNSKTTDGGSSGSMVVVVKDELDGFKIPYLPHVTKRSSTFNLKRSDDCAADKQTDNGQAFRLRDRSGSFTGGSCSADYKQRGIKDAVNFFSSNNVSTSLAGPKMEENRASTFKPLKKAGPPCLPPKPAKKPSFNLPAITIGTYKNNINSNNIINNSNNSASTINNNSYQHDSNVGDDDDDTVVGSSSDSSSQLSVDDVKTIVTDHQCYDSSSVNIDGVSIISSGGGSGQVIVVVEEAASGAINSQAAAVDTQQQQVTVGSGDSDSVGGSERIGGSTVPPQQQQQPRPVRVSTVIAGSQQTSGARSSSDCDDGLVANQATNTAITITNNNNNTNTTTTTANNGGDSQETHTGGLDNVTTTTITKNAIILEGAPTPPENRRLGLLLTARQHANTLPAQRQVSVKDNRKKQKPPIPIRHNHHSSSTTTNNNSNKNQQQINNNQGDFEKPYLPPPPPPPQQQQPPPLLQQQFDKDGKQVGQTTVKVTTLEEQSSSFSCGSVRRKETTTTTTTIESELQKEEHDNEESINKEQSETTCLITEVDPAVVVVGAGGDGQVGHEESKTAALVEAVTSTTTGRNNNTTNNSDDNSITTTSTTNMSAFKNKKADIHIVSYRKLDTDFYESSFNSNTTLPVPDRRNQIGGKSSSAGINNGNSLRHTTGSTQQQHQQYHHLHRPLSSPGGGGDTGYGSSLKTFGYGINNDSKRNTIGNNENSYGNQHILLLQQQPEIKSKCLDSGISNDSVSFSTTDALAGINTYNNSDQSPPPRSPGNVKQMEISTLTLKDNEGMGEEQKTVGNKCSIEVLKNESGQFKTCIEFTDDDSDSSDIKLQHKSTTSDFSTGHRHSFSDTDEYTDEEMLVSVEETQPTVYQDSMEDANLLKLRECAIREFLIKEQSYVESLENVYKLMEQFNATMGSKECLLTKQDIEDIFFNVPKILNVHQDCVKRLTPKVQNWHKSETVGCILKELMIHFPEFEKYTKNYQNACETITKCSQNNPDFKKIAEEASLNPEREKISLANLLQKPISQLQQNTSFIQVFLQFTPKNHPDHEILSGTWRLTQHNLNDNADQVENDRYLLKADNLVELVNNTRKLRCFFLFSDVLVCTKQKFSQKDVFDVKWFVPIGQLWMATNTDHEGDMKSSTIETVEEIKKKMSSLETDFRKAKDRAKEKLKKKLIELQRELARLSGYLELILKHNKKTYTLLMSTDYSREEWKEAINSLKEKCSQYSHFTTSEVQQIVTNCKKLPNICTATYPQKDKAEEHLFGGSLCVTLHELTGLDEPCGTYCCLELDSCGQFFTKAKSAMRHVANPIWNEEFELELDYSQTLRILCFMKGKDNEGDILIGKTALALSKEWMSNFTRKTISMNKISLVISIYHLPPSKTIQRIPSKVKTGIFGVDIQKVSLHQRRPFPSIISVCTQEIEKRGLEEVGIYRVSGGQSDVKRLKCAFEKNTMRARKIIEDPDFSVHTIAAVLKLYFRELPEPLFTNALYDRFIDVNEIRDPKEKEENLISLIHSLPEVNYNTLIHLLVHLKRINDNSVANKMTNSNLAMIFGQSLMQPAPCIEPEAQEALAFLNAHQQNDVLECLLNMKCAGVNLMKL